MTLMRSVAQLTTASRLLSDLLDQRILVKTGTASRGPSMTYGPEAKFPTNVAFGTSRAMIAVSRPSNLTMARPTSAADLVDSDGVLL